MSVQQLERSLARLKIETDEKYDALWVKYTKQMEQDAILIAHLRKKLPAEHRGSSEFTLLAKDLRDLILKANTDFGCQAQATLIDFKDAFESLFRIITGRITPSHQDVDNIRIIKEGLASNGILDA
jgi:hypothetical protein